MVQKRLRCPSFNVEWIFVAISRILDDWSAVNKNKVLEFVQKREKLLTAQSVLLRIVKPRAELHIVALQL